MLGGTQHVSKAKIRTASMKKLKNKEISKSAALHLAAGGYLDRPELSSLENDLQYAGKVSFSDWGPDNCWLRNSTRSQRS